MTEPRPEAEAWHLHARLLHVASVAVGIVLVAGPITFIVVAAFLSAFIAVVGVLPVIGLVTAIYLARRSADAAAYARGQGPRPG